MAQSLSIGLECASCGTREDVHVVCHHCGKPLCDNRELCRIEIEDDVFSDNRQTPVNAIHCNDCWQAYHPHTRAKKLGVPL